MGKLRINEIEVIVKTIINKTYEKREEKVKNFIQNYVPTKQEKQYLTYLNELKILTEKKETLRKKLQISSTSLEGFLREKAYLKYPCPSINQQKLKDSIILKNIDPLFNVETFINNTVNNLIVE